MFRSGFFRAKFFNLGFFGPHAQVADNSPPELYDARGSTLAFDANGSQLTFAARGGRRVNL